MLPHEKEEERRLVKELPPGKKLEHFFQYYLLQTVLIAGGILLVIALIWNFFFRKVDKTVLAAVIYDEVLTDEGKAELTEALRERLELTDEHEVIRLDDSYYSASMQDQMRLTVLLAAREYDVVIAGEEKFRQMAGEGYFVNLADAFTKDQLERLGEAVLSAPGRLETESQSLTEDGSGKGETAPYGLKLKDSKRWKALGGVCPDPVLGLLMAAKNDENAVRFASFLLPALDQ